ncbi:hypothetical protein [Maribacter sp. 2-571]|uniref:hypothetical protein n=1 Tax=Maribacter sp. 2-571 TaxID=3417569 RepID=UPI003D3282DA
MKAMPNNSLLKFLLVIGFCGCSPHLFAQNLLDSSVWTPGTGSVGIFNQYGTNDNTLRENDTDPYGNESLVWKAVGPVSSASKSGGWDSEKTTIPDNTKAYRYTVWVKKTGNLDINGSGKTSFGLGAHYNDYGGFAGKNIDGSQPANSHFFYGFLPELDKWYLMVGFIHGKDKPFNSPIEGGIYDATTGDMVMPMQQEFVFSQNTNRISSKFYLYGEYYDVGKQYFWNPSIYETTDPQMPSVSEMLAPAIAAAAGGGGGLWSANTNGIHYNSGNVGIGTADPGADWKLAVNGKIRAKEIKVETGWADYVFEKDYPLPTLAEVEEQIAKKGHLINIPSAKEVEADGIELGEMNRLLLEKIEELTLYTLQQQRELQKLKTAVKKLSSRDDCNSLGKESNTK